MFKNEVRFESRLWKADLHFALADGVAPDASFFIFSAFHGVGADVHPVRKVGALKLAIVLGPPARSGFPIFVFDGDFGLMQKVNEVQCIIATGLAAF